MSKYDMAILYWGLSHQWIKFCNTICAWLAPPVGTSVMVNEWTLFLEWNIFLQVKTATISSIQHTQQQLFKRNTSPKNENSVIIYSPPNLYGFLSSVEHNWYFVHTMKVNEVQCCLGLHWLSSVYFWVNYHFKWCQHKQNEMLVWYNEMSQVL